MFFQEVSFNGCAVVKLRWLDFKNIVINNKKLSLQFIENNTTYTVFSVEENVAYVCDMLKPDDSSRFDYAQYWSDYSQEQNDADVIDFELNYKTNCNSNFNPKAVSGVIGLAPAKGLGTFVPEPDNNPYQPDADEIVSLYVDGEGSLVTRSSTLTDEGSFRDDFTGSIEQDITGTLTFVNGSNEVIGSGTLFTEELDRDHFIKLKTDGYECWAKIMRAPNNTSILLEEPYIGVNASGAAVKSRWIAGPIGLGSSVLSEQSKIKISSGTDGYSGLYVLKHGDYQPILSIWKLSISQRIDNQVGFFGFRDDVLNPKTYCDVVFDGYDNKYIKFRSAWNLDEQLTLVKLPSGLTTDQELRYKIDISIDYCALQINGVLVAKHEDHVVDPYTEFELCAGIYNNGATDSTDIVIDNVLMANQNILQIGSSFQSPLPMITKEDQHSLIGNLTTSSTTANQVICQYEVPAGKVMYIIGYRIENAGSLSGKIKIGKNSFADDFTSPGLIDGDTFRVFSLEDGMNTGEVDFGANPRKLGVGGDIIKVVVSPSGSLQNCWFASLDFVLR